MNSKAAKVRDIGVYFDQHRVGVCPRCGSKETP